MPKVPDRCPHGLSYDAFREKGFTILVVDCALCHEAGPPLNAAKSWTGAMRGGRLVKFKRLYQH